MTRPIPYPAETKAKGWRFELDLEQAHQSDTWALAAPEARPWLLMLWTVAWLQVPCGSMPDDDELIAAKLGMPIKAFQKHKRVLLRGWWMAEDGRLYQDTIVSRVKSMLDAKEDARQRKADYRARKESERQSQSSKSVPPMSHGTNAGQQADGHGKDNTGTRTGTKGSSLRSEPPPTPKGERFVRFWAAYPNKTGKGAAEKSFEKLKVTEELLTQMLKALSMQQQSEKWRKDGGQYIPMPSTWLNQRRWEDTGLDVEMVEAQQQPWTETGPGIRAMGVKLGEGDWDESREQWYPYRDRVFAKAREVGLLPERAHA